MDDENDPYFTLANGIVTHNCRLRSDNSTEYFNSIGGTSISIGSLGVVTINLPRLAVRAIQRNDEDIKHYFLNSLEEMIITVGKINNAKRNILKRRIDNGNFPLYTHGFMELSRQYSTCGFNGLNEAVEILGMKVLNEDGQQFVIDCLELINVTNEKLQKQYKAPHNCEQTPSESSSVKLAEKDTILGFNENKYLLYSNQFIPLTTKADIFDRIRLHGKFDSMLSGGASLHLNLAQKVENSKTIEDLIKICAKFGVIYFCLNYNLQLCKNGHLGVGKSDKCSICGDVIIENLTRIVGYLTVVSSWSNVRREIDYPNRQQYNGELEKFVTKETLNE
jgi:ribonucleoside-triphosphate reductase